MNLIAADSATVGKENQNNAEGIDPSTVAISESGIATDGKNLYVADYSIRKIEIATGDEVDLGGDENSGSVGITTDGKNLYVTSSGGVNPGGVIRKIVIATGKGTVIAGSGTLEGIGEIEYSVDGSGTEASFYHPTGITTDGKNLYVADTWGDKIRKVVIATGMVTTLAASPGTDGRDSRNSTGTVASFSHPAGVATDGSNLYVADTDNHKICKIVIASGEVTTLAGSGENGSLDGIGKSAKFSYPYGVTTDGSNLYVADTGVHKIRKIVIATGEVTTLAGSGKKGSIDAIGMAATFNFPNSIATDGSNLYVYDGGDSTVRKIVIATGVVTTLSGEGTPDSLDGTAAAATFMGSHGITTDGNNLYVTETQTHKIRKVVIATGEVTTLVGSITEGSIDATGLAASFNNPEGITTDGSNLYVADQGNKRIRKVVIATGVVTTLAGGGDPRGITVDGNNLYVTDHFSIRKIASATGAVTTFLGSEAAGYSDSKGVRFKSLTAITSDGSSLYVVDGTNNTIHKIVIATGEVSTLAVSGTEDALDASAGHPITYPMGITTDGSNLYVADSHNHRIRKIEIATGVVTTLAGSELFYSPNGITTDGRNLYVADGVRKKIFKIVISTGEVTTLAGSGN
jgi:sugar lactone lactonase YvrE